MEMICGLLDDCLSKTLRRERRRLVIGRDFEVLQRVSAIFATTLWLLESFFSRNTGVLNTSYGVLITRVSDSLFWCFQSTQAVGDSLKPSLKMVDLLAIDQTSHMKGIKFGLRMFFILSPYVVIILTIFSYDITKLNDIFRFLFRPFNTIT